MPRDADSPRDASAVPSEGTADIVLAIDPGRAKCGVAVVSRTGQALHRAVVPTEAVLEAVHNLIAVHRPHALIVGGGTGSRPLLRTLQEASLGVSISPVDEAHSSEAARARFVAENAPRGWQRFLPRSLRTPWRAYDDYVAVILAERYWGRDEG